MYMSQISIKGLRRLSKDDLRQLSDIILAELYIEDLDDDVYLSDADYVWCELEKNGKTYTMIHGYPGDNPLGLIFVKDGSEAVAHVGEGCDDKDEWQQWYLTQDTSGGYLSGMFVVD